MTANPSMPPFRPETERFVLTDTDANVNLADWSITSADLGIDPPVPISVRKTTLHGGRQEGSALIEIRAGEASVVVIPTRGMGVLKARFKGVTLGWQSPVDEIVNPAFLTLGERGGLGWLDGFNEMLVRCGFEWSGHAAVEGGAPYTLHGRAGNTPASKVIVEIDRAPPHRIAVHGLIKEKAFKLADFECWTTLVVTPGRAGFTLSDSLTNLSDYERPYQILYHANFGPPLLEEGSRFLAPALRVAPFNDAAKPGLAEWDTYLGPTRGFDEMVFVCELAASPEGRTVAALIDRAATRGVTVRYAPSELPFFTLWKNTDTLRQGYVTGLEAGTNPPYARPVEAARDRLRTLAPGQSTTFTIDVDVLPSPEAVADATARIAALGSAAAPVVCPEAEYR